jgi:hypothetical protein
MQRADQLPPEFRDRFVDGFGNAAENGLHVGARQTGGEVQAVPGMPTQVAQQLQQLTEEVFKNGFVDAMHPTLILPIAVVALAALTCFAVKQRKHEAHPEVAEQQSTEEAA